MRMFQFQCINNDLIEVQAGSEAEARDLVMKRRWGPPSGIYSDPYRGTGLFLLSPEEDASV